MNHNDNEYLNEIFEDFKKSFVGFMKTEMDAMKVDVLDFESQDKYMERENASLIAENKGLMSKLADSERDRHFYQETLRERNAELNHLHEEHIKLGALQAKEQEWANAMIEERELECAEWKQKHQDMGAYIVELQAKLANQELINAQMPPMNTVMGKDVSYVINQILNLKVTDFNPHHKPHFTIRDLINSNLWKDPSQ